MSIEEEHKPNEQEILGRQLTSYLTENDPLGVGHYELLPLPAAEYHQNYKIETEKGSFVVRMSVLQLSRKTDQLAQEYAYLEYLSKFGTAPKPAHIDMNGFEYPFLIEEFIEGGHIEELTPENLDKCADVLVDLYNTPLEEGHPFEVRQPRYEDDLTYYRGVYEEYEGAEEIAHWAERVDASTQQVAVVLERLQPLLENTEPKLIRRDANPKNLIDQGDHLRWIDWEVARVDDPVTTLASFINETELYDWFDPKLQPEQREAIAGQFFTKTGLQHGQELLQARLLLERYWGMIWAIERICKHKRGELPEHLSTKERLDWYEFIAEESHEALQKDLAEL
jgi:thiamine kinase-like enzyme